MNLRSHRLSTNKFINLREVKYYIQWQKNWGGHIKIHSQMISLVNFFHSGTFWFQDDPSFKAEIQFWITVGKMFIATWKLENWNLRNLMMVIWNLTFWFLHFHGNMLEKRLRYTGRYIRTKNVPPAIVFSSDQLQNQQLSGSGFV